MYYSFTHHIIDLDIKIINHNRVCLRHEKLDRMSCKMVLLVVAEGALHGLIILPAIMAVEAAIANFCKEKTQ